MEYIDYMKTLNMLKIVRSKFEAKYKEVSARSKKALLTGIVDLELLEEYNHTFNNYLKMMDIMDIILAAADEEVSRIKSGLKELGVDLPDIDEDNFGKSL